MTRKADQEASPSAPMTEALAEALASRERFRLLYEQTLGELVLAKRQLGKAGPDPGREADPVIQAMISVAHEKAAAEIGWLRRGCDTQEQELAEGRCWTQSLGQHVERLAEQIGILGALRDAGFDVRPKKRSK